MFTGLIEEMGCIESLRQAKNSGQLVIQAKNVLENTNPGDSIAVNGICLTVTHVTKTAFTADVMPETLKRSNLGQLKLGALVHLERAMAANGRFGGHMVSGHIDGTGTICTRTREGNATRLYITAPKNLLLQIVEKGSVAIDGVSLTVISVEENRFSVGIIPHTSTQTMLFNKNIGDIVNLETDIIGKYIQHFLGISQKNHDHPITADFLRDNGF